MNINELMSRLNVDKPVIDASPFPGTWQILFTPSNESERQIALGYGKELDNGKIEILMDEKHHNDWFDRFSNRVTGKIEKTRLA